MLLFSEKCLTCFCLTFADHDSLFSVSGHRPVSKEVGQLASIWCPAEGKLDRNQLEVSWKAIYELVVAKTAQNYFIGVKFNII